MKNIKWLTVAILLLFSNGLFATTENHPSSATKDTQINGTSYSIAGTYIAGKGGAKAGSMQTEGIKFRLNRTVGNVSNAIEFAVKTGYTISQLDFCGHVNDNSKTSSISQVLVDGQSISFSPVTLPAKTSSVSFSFSGFSAAQSIVIVFSGDGTQANLEYTVTYSNGSTPPATIPVESVALNKTTTSIVVGATETLTETVSPSNATNKAVTWSSNNTAVATVDQNGLVTAVAAGQATITVTTADGNFTASCVVTVTTPSSDPIPVTGVSLNKTSTSIKVGATETLTVTYTPSNATTGKTLLWMSFNNGIATVSNNGVVTGVAAGSTTIHVSTEGGFSATCDVTVTPANPVPQTNLALHEPGVYEAKSKDGGYDAPLIIDKGREYEVYYLNREENNLSVSTTTTDRSGNITISTSQTETKAKDGWFEIKGNGSGEAKDVPAEGEFTGGWRRVNLKANDTIKMHIKGFDQFSIMAYDANADASKDQRIVVLIDNVQMNMTCSKAYSVRRFDCTTSEHVIVVTAHGTSTNQFTAFSLRVAQEPRTKHLKGNDSTQTILATTAPKSVYYYTKYNSLPGAMTELKWVGDTATGIKLTQKPSAAGAIGDTLVLGGTANCPAGLYHYRVVSSLNGVETSSVSGQFTVYNKITAMTGTTVEVYQGEEMDEIRFAYYTFNPNDVTFTWQGQTPAGITASANNGKFTISGTPTTTGTYPFSISVPGSEAINGKIIVNPLDLGNNPIMYLYKNDSAYKKDGVYKYLMSQGKNLIKRRTKSELRSADQYKQYKWILISEDVDADNAEVLAIARGDANLPVLNMKGFSYTEGRLDWGEPNNGTLDSVNDHRYKIFVQRADHPIFNGWNQGDSIQILNRIDRRGVMPIAVDLENTLCLATAYTRGKNYYEDGELQTILHEIPAAMRKGKKYLCLPIAQSSSQYLTEDGKKLISAAVNYLTNDQGTVALPQLEITDFAIGNEHAEIDQMNNTISLELDAQTYPDLAKLRPAVKLAAPTFTFIATPVTDTVNFESSYFAPIEYIVSDYINRRVYEVTITHNQLQSIDNVYTDGEWVNVYDIYGRLIVTTNENIYTMSLPRGMYLIVTASGQTIKLMK